MSEKSPLFVSAIELVAHATQLYAQGRERNYKFVILHLANAVELILKDRLIDNGVSIYKPRKRPQTITIWDAFQSLENVNIIVPERPVIELLVDDRNTIQHRFGFPNADTVYYYLEEVVAFFKRFLDEQYGADLADILQLYLSKEDLELLGLLQKAQDEYAVLERLFELSPQSAILQAYNLVESRFLQVVGPRASGKSPSRPFWRMPGFARVLDELGTEGFLPPDVATQFSLLRDFRNRAAHAPVGNQASKQDWAAALDVAKSLLVGLDRAVDEGRLPTWQSREADSDTDTFGDQLDLGTARDDDSD